jgi:ribosomal subunit interface protein
MQTTITVRHEEIADGLRGRAMSVVERLGRVTPSPMEMAVVFERDGGTAAVELRLHLAGGALLVAWGEAPDHRTALDRAEEKLRRQIARASDRLRSARTANVRHPL